MGWALTTRGAILIDYGNILGLREIGRGCAVNREKGKLLPAAALAVAAPSVAFAGTGNAETANVPCPASALPFPRPDLPTPAARRLQGCDRQPPTLVLRRPHGWLDDYRNHNQRHLRHNGLRDVVVQHVVIYSVTAGWASRDAKTGPTTINEASPGPMW